MAAPSGIYRFTMSYYDNIESHLDNRPHGPDLDGRTEQTGRPDQADYEHLLKLRTGLRRFLRWSEQQARAEGLTPAKHQLLLAIRGHPDQAGPTVGNIADYLVVRHHSAVELINRAAADGLVKRIPDVNGRGVVRVTLTSAAADKLDSLGETHLQQLAHLAPTMRTLWQQPQAIRGRGGGPRDVGFDDESTAMS
jgi:DNA-binding MarR family transcriptional regulator